MVEHCAIERVARESYGRLLAFLTAQTSDWAAAEDALSEAFRSAMAAWPVQGMPEKPEAWLLVVARRRLSDYRRQNARLVDMDVGGLSQELDDELSSGAIPDERLCMLFLCAHPAIDPSLHAPLMLQAVFGMTAERIASAFLVRPATMGQRLSRAKVKIKQAKIRFELPEGNALRSRLSAVMDAVYAAYGSGWDALEGSEARQHGLAEEAIFLGRLLAELLPGDAEAQGLAALMLYCESRKAARRSKEGRYIPLAEQDVTLWSKDLIREAEQHLARAAAMAAPGRFQLEAAIQSAHTFRLTTGFGDWSVIAELYQGLLQYCPSIGVRVSHIAAVSEACGAERGLELLGSLPSEQVAAYQPYWALAAHLQARSGRPEAKESYCRAAGLSEDESVRRFLLAKASGC